MTLSDNLQQLKNQLPPNVKIVAVSKNHGIDKIMEVYNTGQRAFGENRVQELLWKYEQLPKDIEWHMIGHLQRNKVKNIAPFVDIIQSVDSLRLAKEINKEAAKNNRTIRCLLQIHIAQEDTKYGLSVNELNEVINNYLEDKLTSIDICGLMGMATFTDNTQQIGRDFSYLQGLFLNLKADRLRNQENFSELSMGMTSDYPIAIAYGSTMVRIGSAIFGER